MKKIEIDLNAVTLLKKGEIRRCYYCNNYPRLKLPEIELQSTKGLKFIIKNFTKNQARIGCCNIEYEGSLANALNIVKMWNSHTRTRENLARSDK